MWVFGNSMPGSGTSICKGPGVGACLEWSEK